MIKGDGSRSVSSLRMGACIIFAMAQTIYAVGAQEMLPDTPIELRDFKLQPEPAKPQPQPHPKPHPRNVPPSNSDNANPAQNNAAGKASDNIAVPTPETTAAVPSAVSAKDAVASLSKGKGPPLSSSPKAVRTNATPGPSAKPKETTSQRPLLDGQEANAAAILNREGQLRDEEIPTAAISGKMGDKAAMASKQAESVMSAIPWVAVGIAILFAALAAAILYWRKGAKIGVRQIKQPEPAISPNTVGLEPLNTSDLASAIATLSSSDKRQIMTKKTDSGLKRPQLKMLFVPDKAKFSLVNLAISGKLHIENIGDAPVKSMRLHSAIISAHENQNDEISHFFELDELSGDELGEAKIGEKIQLDLNLVAPLAEISAFPFQDQHLFVPILLARLCYHWGQEQSDDSQLSCLVGREATPPNAKMGALRLDLGPRSVGSLGLRPVFGQ